MYLRRLIAASALAGAATCGVASAQTPGLYVFHSKAQGGCPALDWHIALEATATGDNLSGMIGWDNMQHIARVTGRLDPNTKQFQMTAQEVGGSRTASINGLVNANGRMTATMSGEGVNCKNLTIPLYRPPAGGGQH